MRPAILVSVLVFSVVALAHLLRLVFQLDVVVGGTEVPMSVSIVGLVITAALALGLSRESGKQDRASKA